MYRPILTCAFLAFATTALSAQQSSDPYQGQSHPPTDDVITTTQAEQAKPPAGKPMVAPAPPPVAPAQAAAPAQAPVPALATPPPAEPQPEAGPVEAEPSEQTRDSSDGTDAGIVQVAPDGEQPQSVEAPRLRSRGYARNTDEDIVHPAPLPPGTLEEGTTIRVRLLTYLSTTQSEPGQDFQTRVASDVLEGGQVLIPAGAQILGKVVDVSEGHAGGHGSIRLRPDTVILQDGTRYQLDASVSGAPGTNTRVSDEGTINAGSRWKKDGIEYGGAVGTGAVAGAVLGGPVGALTGSLIGAGAVTVHLLSDHPQASLEPGTVLLITLSQRLSMVANGTQGE